LAGDTGDREIATQRVTEVPGLLGPATLRLPFVEAGGGKDDPRAQQRARPGLGRAVGTDVERLAVLLESPAQEAQFRLRAARGDDGDFGAGRDVVAGVPDQVVDEAVDQRLRGLVLEGFATP